MQQAVVENNGMATTRLPPTVAFDGAGIQAMLLDLDQSLYVICEEGRIGLIREGNLRFISSRGAGDLVAFLPPMRPDQLGDPAFRASYDVDWAYATGAMAGGIASEELVITLGQAGLLGSFGAGGLSPTRLEQAIQRIQQALGPRSAAFNLIHSPNEPILEQSAVGLYLKYGVQTVEASAFMDLTPNLVYFRAAGLSLDSANCIRVQNKIIAKISRREVALKFLQPASLNLLRELVSQGRITETQAALAQQVPMADDITVEADSGGHTDNRPLVCLLPSVLALRDEVHQRCGYTQKVRVGAAGGIGTPQAALAAFMMGAAYVVTGSVNQSCVESGTSEHIKTLLAQCAMTDVVMAPAADMFEQGVKLQVLKRGTFFPVRAQKLYELYRSYDAIEAIPAAQREQLEQQIFKRSLDSVWEETVAFFARRDPEQIQRAAENPKRKMALIFRWYLGLSSRWARTNDPDYKLDYQVWCGPAMGAFNDWVRGSYLAEPNQRQVVEVARQIMTGAAYLYRVQSLQAQGIQLPAECASYLPTRR
ncbi:PfaD family polyunsaturated fatty acid/polyketide biosynthesis protein [Anthocerotibacter panamensis]|uniref:PfaD family polyunsaturated fatty acid/polyketide biosynthesis protein n=1 Tax=Anthocerotibacter panamensis TaxID=2857077 RepID=UPI001C401C6B|nr:PfaD family polyunsaturated fatty acid/polyketide biosynthesis protein [Anthocerotibacter panamensis]